MVRVLNLSVKAERYRTNKNGDLSKAIGSGCIGSNYSELFMYSESGAILGHYDLCAPFDEDVVYIDSIPVARVLNQAVFPLEADHLGSPRAMQNPDGTASVWTWNLLSNSPTGSNAFGEQAPTGKQVFNLRFPGQYADGDGLHYKYFRDYEAGTGRYVESDPIGLEGGISTYGYVESNPAISIDRLGLRSGLTITIPPRHRTLPNSRGAPGLDPERILRSCNRDPNCITSPTFRDFCVKWECTPPHVEACREPPPPYVVEEFVSDIGASSAPHLNCRCSKMASELALPDNKPPGPPREFCAQLSGWKRKVCIALAIAPK